MHALGLKGTEDAGLDGTCDHRERDTHLSRMPYGPFACAFLSGLIDNDIHHRKPCFRIFLGKDLRGQFNQERIKVALIPG